jgi:hypothetical protein
MPTPVARSASAALEEHHDVHISDLLDALEPVEGTSMTIDLESRIRRLEDRALISERVIEYAIAVDRGDWKMFAGCFTDPVHTDYSESGMPAADLARDELAAIVRGALGRFTATQHLSPNHVIEFDEEDADRAICHSYMYAQHYIEGSEGGEFFLLRGSYTNHMLRTSDGWRIESIIQHVSWSDRTGNAAPEATARDRTEPGDA